MDIRKEIGEAMTNARIKSGLSRSEIARRLGVSNVTVYYWETGRNPIMVVPGRIELPTPAFSVHDFNAEKGYFKGIFQCSR